MTTRTDGAQLVAELRRLAGSLDLDFPIETREDFVRQVTSRTATVELGGVAYDARFGAGLVPSFFFPIADIDDLLLKSTELMVSRGMVDESVLRGGDA